MTNKVDEAATRVFLINILRGRLRTNTEPEAQAAFEALTHTEREALILKVFRDLFSARDARLAEKAQRKAANKAEREEKREAARAQRKVAKRTKTKVTKTAKPRSEKKAVATKEVTPVPGAQPDALKKRVEALLAVRAKAKKA